MRYGSVCSGIEAATVAWHPLGWDAAWFAEIEQFPCAVLSHHYPDVPNLGNMTLIADSVRSGTVEAPDMLVGGTPCQAFSVAGLRNSLEDNRGQLTLEYIRIFDAIDDVRIDAGSDPAVCVWENVPGVLNTSDNAFGCFLGGLVGANAALVPPNIGGGVDGQARVWLLDPGERLLGEFSMLNISECPNDAVVSSLSQVLETDSIPQRFFLSNVACTGILRRADRRGKSLPQSLQEALQAVASGLTSTAIVD